MKEKIELPTITVSSFSKKEESNYVLNNFAMSEANIEHPKIMLDYPNIVNDVIFGICVKGRGLFNINLNTYEVSTNSIVILPPGTILQSNLSDMSNDFSIYYLTFSLDFLINLEATDIYSAKETPCLKLGEEEVKTLLKTYEYLSEKYTKKSYSYHEEVIQYSLLSAIFEFCSIYAQNKPQQDTSNRDNEFQKKFYDLLFKHYRMERKIKFYADKLFLTPQYLSAKIKSLTNKTVGEWINESVILEAKALLKSSDRTIQEISIHLNYPDASSFGKFFRKHVGMSPKEYRQS